MAILGFVLHLLLLPIVLAAGLVVPWWGIPILLAAWVVALVVMFRNRHLPQIVMAPILTLAFLIAFASAGEWLLDWSA